MNRTWEMWMSLGLLSLGIGLGVYAGWALTHAPLSAIAPSIWERRPDT